MFFVHRLDELAALGDRVGHRLFEVDVLARVRGGDGVGGVPEVGGDDQDAVDVLAGQELAEIAVSLTVLAASLPVSSV